MGATTSEVAGECKTRLRNFADRFPVLDTAFIEYVPSRNQLRLTTLLGKDDMEAENSLAALELGIEQLFVDVSLAFSTIHLRGRDPQQFIPEGALVIFGRSARPRADAAATR